MLHRFGLFELDTDRFELRAEGVVQPVEPQVFALLRLLVENRDRLVSKSELVEKVWDGRIVSESTLSSRIKSARKALGDDGRAQCYIRTLHGRGFRFVAEVRSEPSAPETVRVGAPGGAGPPAAAADFHPEPAERPSIAVLPFRRLGDAGTYTALADALPDELIAELSRLRWLFVTSRASSFRLRDSGLGATEVGRLLQVRYCLSGTLELVGPGLVVTTELADTRDGGVVWAERFAGALDDVHALREQIRSCILSALEIRIPFHEASLARGRACEDLDAWSAYHLGLQHMYRFNIRDNAAAAALFEQAVALDPGFARAHAGLSFLHFQTAFLRYTEDRAAEIERARSRAERGLELDPLDPFVHFTMGRTYLAGGRSGGQHALARARHRTEPELRPRHLCPGVDRGPGRPRPRRPGGCRPRDAPLAPRPAALRDAGHPGLRPHGPRRGAGGRRVGGARRSFARGPRDDRDGRRGGPRPGRRSRPRRRLGRQRAQATLRPHRR